MSCLPPIVTVRRRSAAARSRFPLLAIVLACALNPLAGQCASWVPAGSGLNGPVTALVLMPNGDLVAGGGFTLAGGIPANRIARWNGTSWSALGSGGATFGLPLSASAQLIGMRVVARGFALDPFGARGFAGSDAVLVVIGR